VLGLSAVTAPPCEKLFLPKHDAPLSSLRFFSPVGSVISPASSSRSPSHVFLGSALGKAMIPLPRAIIGHFPPSIPPFSLSCHRKVSSPGVPKLSPPPRNLLSPFFLTLSAPFSRDLPQAPREDLPLGLQDSERTLPSQQIVFSSRRVVLLSQRRSCL